LQEIREYLTTIKMLERDESSVSADVGQCREVDANNYGGTSPGAGWTGLKLQRSQSVTISKLNKTCEQDDHVVSTCFGIHVRQILG
jgi:hypothetical protein